MQDIVFTTRLTEADWDDTLRGWRCPPLAVPGAKVEALYIDGARIDTAKYEVLAGQNVIRWTPSDKPVRVAATVRLTEDLTLGTETDRWRKLAILLPVIATIAAALVSGFATYATKSSPEPAPPPAKSSAVTKPPSDNTGSLALGKPSSAPPSLGNLDGRSTSLRLGETGAGTATTTPSWFKVVTTAATAPREVHVVVRNTLLTGVLEARLFDAGENNVETKTDYAGANLVLDTTTEHGGVYYVAVRTLFKADPMPFEIVVTQPD